MDRRQVLLTALLGLTTGSPVFAQGNGHGHGGGPPEGRGPDSPGHRGGPPGNPGSASHGYGGGPPSLGQHEYDLVQSWRGANPYWAAPDLPPGQLRRLEQGKPLPPGIARKILPPGLLATLPVYPGYTYYAVGPDVVLIAAATGLVAGLLAGALAR
jgi:hypothetical protein